MNCISLKFTELIEVVRQLRQRTPVLVCSGYVEEDLLKRGIHAGEVHYLPKPFAPTQLVHRVQALLAVSLKSGG